MEYALVVLEAWGIKPDVGFVMYMIPGSVRLSVSVLGLMNIDGSFLEN